MCRAIFVSAHCWVCLEGAEVGRLLVPHLVLPPQRLYTSVSLTVSHAGTGQHRPSRHPRTPGPRGDAGARARRTHIWGGVQNSPCRHAPCTPSITHHPHTYRADVAAVMAHLDHRVRPVAAHVRHADARAGEGRILVGCCAFRPAPCQRRFISPCLASRWACCFAPEPSLSRSLLTVPREPLAPPGSHVTNALQSVLIYIATESNENWLGPAPLEQVCAVRGLAISPLAAHC